MPEVSDIQAGDGPSARAAIVGASTASVTDGRGRQISLRKLGPLDHLRLFEVLGAGLSENNAYLNYAMVAAAVSSIDGYSEPFPTSKLQIEAMIGRLDHDGFLAASAAYRKSFSAGESGDPEAIKK